MQGELSSRDALVVRSRCSMPFFGVKPPPPLSSRRPHRTFTIPLSPSCRAIIQVETRSLCAHGARCPSLASSRRHRRCCVLAVHIGRLLYRSRHRAGRTFESRRARCALTVLDALLALTVLDALLWRQEAAVALCSRAVHIGRLLYRYIAFAIVQGGRFSRSELNPVQYRT